MDGKPGVSQSDRAAGRAAGTRCRTEGTASRGYPHRLEARPVGARPADGHGASIDTTTPAGKVGVRHLRRARGRKGGPPFKVTAAKVLLAMAAMGQKETKVTDLCSELAITGKRSTGTSRQIGRCARMD
jgi:hypothetical protein